MGSNTNNSIAKEENSFLSWKTRLSSLGAPKLSEEETDLYSKLLIDNEITIDMVSYLNHDMLQSAGINNIDHRERILSMNSKDAELHSSNHETQPIPIKLKINTDRTQLKNENDEHNDEMKDTSYSSESSDSSEDERSEDGSDGGTNVTADTNEHDDSDEEEENDDGVGEDRDDEEFHGNRQQQSQLNYERYIQSLNASSENNNSQSTATPPPRKRGRPFKIRDENNPNYVKQKYKKNPNKTKKDKNYRYDNANGSNLDANGKRKRGRPPGKKNQPKLNNFSDSDNSPNSPVQVMMTTTSSSPNIYKKQYQHPSPSLSSSSSSIPIPISPSLSSSVNNLEINPMKKGRGRPKKSSSGSITPYTDLSNSSDNQIYMPITPTSSYNSKFKLPSDFEICNFVKDLIIEHNRTNKNGNSKENYLTAEHVIKKLENYYGVDFSCRKFFLNEIFEVIAI